MAEIAQSIKFGTISTKEDFEDLVITNQITITQVYRVLTVGAAMAVCLAHGSNDVANAISPLVVVLGLENK